MTNNSPLSTYNPYDRLPRVPTFELTSPSIKNLTTFDLKQVDPSQGGQGISPEISWSGFPSETKSFAVTIFDPDAPTASGFWHWLVHDIPTYVTSLPEGAGSVHSHTLPQEAKTLKNDARTAEYIGPCPPAKHGAHRYFIVVHALDVPSLNIDPESTGAFLGFTMYFHTIGRATLVGTWQNPE